jgi:nucleotidyltransferase substrate binding protein (TIGR01987 family)
MNNDVRWQQRFSNYCKALSKLGQAIAYLKERNREENEELDTEDYWEQVADDIIKEGLIQRFEYTHELAWNVMKDYAFDQGNTTVGGSKDATREAFQLQIINDGKVWMDMIASRNKTSHTYNEETANEIFSKIVNNYYSAFLAFRETMEGKRSGQQQNIF